MPQPFVFEEGPLHVAIQRWTGALAAMIGLVAIHWAHLENTLSRIFTALLDGKQDFAFEKYHMIVDRELRNKTFIAAATAAGLPKDIIEEAEELFGDIRKKAGERNAVVHEIWAYIDEKK